MKKEFEEIKKMIEKLEYNISKEIEEYNDFIESEIRALREEIGDQFTKLENQMDQFDSDASIGPSYQ